MLFNSLEFLFIFLPVVFIVYFVLNKFKLYKSSKIFLILASFYFYGSYKIDYIWILLSSIIFNYTISHILNSDIKKDLKKYILIFGITGNLFLLIFFKYFTFLADIFHAMNIIPFDTMKIIMPFGISFFTIQQISYIIDCYRNEIKNYNIIDYILFICFFPQLISGPIVRHQEIIPQFNDLSKKSINQDNIYFGLFMITIGLVKKVIFADSLVDFIDYCSLNYAVFEYFNISWTYCISVILQGYFDFSGYCDMAIGIAVLFNIYLPWNFNSPYQASSITEFWQRWNMTLVRFLKYYIYYPLGGEKKGYLRTFINTMSIFLLYGIWFGNNPLKIFYGLINGVLVCINKIWDKFNITIPKVLSKAITFITIILMVPFIKAERFNDAFNLLKSLFGINFSLINTQPVGLYMIFMLQPPHNAKINIFIFIAGLFLVLFFKNSTQLARLYIKSTNFIYTIMLVVLFIFSALSITKSHSFVYFNF